MMDFTPTAAEALGVALTEAVDQALVAFRKAEYDSKRGSGAGDVAKRRIGAGYIGVECGRQLAFKYHKAPVENREVVYVTPGELQRHAESGFWAEEKIADWLKLAGFKLLTKGNDGSQFGYKTAKDPETGQFRIAGEVDGVILGVPEKFAGLISNECLWESKKATDKKWKKFSKEGVRKADPKYYGQLQCNMANFSVSETLFTMLNLDSMQFYWELVRHDPQYSRGLMERAYRVLESESPEELERIGNNSTDSRCKFCDYRERCWKVPVAPAVATPSWLAKAPAAA